MIIFEYVLKTQFDQNIHQNAPNCTILKKIIGGACLENRWFSSLMHSGLCFVMLMIVTNSFEKMLSENANFKINNVNNEFSLLMEYGITY